MYPFMFKTRAYLKIPSARNLIKHALNKHVPKLLILYHVNLPKLMRHSENTTTSPPRTQALLGIFWGSRCARGHGKASRSQGSLSCLEKEAGEITLGTRLPAGKWKAYYVEPFLVIVFFALSHDPCAASQTTSKGLFTRRWGTLGKWGYPLRWGNPPIDIHFNFITFTS